MIVANYLVAGALFCLGLFTVITRRDLIKIVLGLSLMESSTYLLLVSLAYRRGSDSEREFWRRVLERGEATDAALAHASGLMAKISVISCAAR